MKSRSSLVGYWKFNGSGSIANGAAISASVGSDGVASNANGTGMSYGSGKLNSSINFDGVDDIFSSTLTSFAPSQFSLIWWLNPSSCTNYNQTLGASANWGAFLFHTTSTCQVYVGTDVPTRFTPTDLPAGTVTLNSWQQFAFTYNSGAAAFYKNGVLLASKTGMNASASWVSISTGTTGNGIAGLMDDLSLWSTSLTGSQIQTIYARQAAKYSGQLTSRVLDAYSSQSWTTLSSSTTLPFYKELPGSAGSESTASYSSVGGSLVTGNVGLWHLNETSGTTAFDSSGSGYNGTLSGSAVFGASGQLSNSVQQTAANGKISVPTSALNFPGTAPFSVSAWLKTSVTGASSFFDILNTRASNGGGGQGWLLYVYGGNGNVNFHRTVNGTEYGPSSSTVNDGNWHHVVGTYDGTQSKIWIDGKFMVGSADTNSMVSVASNLLIMGNGGAVSGSVDEVAIWSRALSASEALELYRRGANRLKYQLRSCSASDCSDQEALTTTYKGWKGPDNTGLSYFSELYNTTSNVLAGTVSTGAPTMTFSNFSGSGLSVSANRYFQYRAILESDDQNTLCNYGAGAAPCSPELQSVAIGPNHYDTTIQSIISKASIGSAYQTLDVNGMTETLGSNACSSGAKYSASSDGTTFYYWNGSAWSTSSAYATANDAATMRTNISSFPASAAGTGTLQIKTYLKSSGTSACEVDNLQFTGKRY